MLSKTADPPPGTPLTSLMWGFFYIKRGGRMPEPPWRPRRGPPWVLMGTPPQHSSHPAATQREGGRSPPLASPPYGGGRFPPPPFAGEGARSAPPQAKVKSPSALLSFFN
nr:hypothetical protein [Morchella crassipes]